MKKVFVLSVLVALCLSMQGQLTEVWSNGFQDPSMVEEDYYPMLKKVSDEELVVVGDNHVLKYDTLGNVVWSYELDGIAYNNTTLANHNSHLDADQNGNVYVLSNILVYSNGFDTVMTVVKTIKLDPNGNELWSNQYQYDLEFPEDVGASICFFDNNVYITGRSIDSIHYCDVFLVKYDALSGAEVWRTSFNDDDDDCDRGDIVQVDNEGNIYVGGKSRTTQNNEYLLLKYNPDGDLLWVSRYENPDWFFNLFTDMTITSDNNIVLSGHYYSTVCFSSEGEFLWEFSPESNMPINTTGDAVNDIIPTNDGGIVMTGSHRDSGFPIPDTDILTVKISGSGELIWENHYIESDIIQSREGNILFVDNNNNVYVGGRRSHNNNSEITDNAILLKISGETGNLIWDYVALNNPFEDDVVTSMHVDSSGAIFVTGVNIANGEKQFLTKKYRENSISVDEYDFDQGDFEISPNPAASERIHIKSTQFNGFHFNVRIFDQNGKCVKAQEDFIMGEAIDIADIASGLYFIQIEALKRNYHRKVIIQK